MKMRRSTLPRSSASAVLAFALAFSAAAATKPPAATSATSDDATTVLLGDWLGTLDTGADAAKFRLVLHVGKNPDGTLNASLDSLDEKVKGIAANEPTFAGGTLGLNFPTIAVHCELALAPNRAELKGTWYKLEASFPVDFKKQTAPSSQGR